MTDLREKLEDIRALCDRNPLMVGFVHTDPSRQELQDRLDAIKEAVSALLDHSIPERGSVAPAAVYEVLKAHVQRFEGGYEPVAFDYIRADALPAMSRKIALLSTPTPEGEWVLVPKEPTPEMIEAGRKAADQRLSEWNGRPCHLDGMDTVVGAAFRAMIAAAPAPEGECEKLVAPAIGPGGELPPAYSEQVNGPAPEGGVDKLADALGAFWNAALSATHSYNDPTANAVMAGMVEGVAAVAMELRRSEVPPAPEGASDD